MSTDAPMQEAESTPDWSVVADDIPCPRCGYNLRELTRARCPECGLEFVWSQVIAAARNQSDSPLFEYQWRRRPVRSFLGTTLRLLLPWRFWRDVPITLPVRVGGLLLYLGLTCLVAIVLLVASGVAVYITGWWGDSNRGPYGSVTPWDILWTVASQYPPETLDSYYPRREGTWAFFHDLLLPILTFGCVTWLSVLVFWQTRRKYRIRQSVILRTVAYPTVALILAWCIVYNILWLLRMLWLSKDYGAWLWWTKPEYLSSCIALPPFYAGMGFAWRRHLEVRRGWGLVLLIFVMHAMILVTAVAVAAAISGSFENPVTEAINRFLPPFWRDIYAIPWPF